jgi:hypothetical protein
MNEELWFITIAATVFFAQCGLLLWAQNRITRLESHLRWISVQCEYVLENIGPLSEDDEPELDKLRAIASAGPLK